MRFNGLLSDIISRSLYYYYNMMIGETDYFCVETQIVY